MAQGVHPRHLTVLHSFGLHIMGIGKAGSLRIPLSAQPGKPILQIMQFVLLSET